MIVTDLVALASGAAEKESAAIETLLGTIDTVYAAFQAVLGAMVRVSEMLETECGTPEDRDAIMAELIKASRRTGQVQTSLLKALEGLHTANQATSAAGALECLGDAQEPLAD